MDWSGIPKDVPCKRCANGKYWPGTAGGVGYPPEIPWVDCDVQGVFDVDKSYFDHHGDPYPWDTCDSFSERREL